MLFYVLIVRTVTLPPGVNPIAVDKYIYLSRPAVGPIQFLVIGYREVHSSRVGRLGVKLTAILHLMLGYKIEWSYASTPYVPS